MAIIRAQVTLPYTTNLPRDVAVNTYHFRVSAADDTTAAGIATNLIALYNTSSGGATVANYLSAQITRATNGCTVEFYDRASPEGEPPFYVATFTLGAAGSVNSLPAEVALCSSYVGEVSGDLPLRRRRGRVFIGPLAVGALETGSGIVGNPTDQFVTTLSGATDRLAAAYYSSPGGTEFIVYSRLSNAGSKIVRGWVDQEFDTQRRRQVRATQRTVWDLTV